MIDMTSHHFRKLFRSLDAVFYRAVFVIAAAFVLTVLFRYNNPWMHPEVPWRDIPNVMSTGETLLLSDLLRAFDCWKLDGVSRTRFLSYLFQICNIKLRIRLWNFLPPHPSFSLTWLFSLVLSPLLLFKLVHNLTRSRDAAWASLSLYVLSTGFLSGVLLLFHPGKPLANFFLILCLYLASRISVHRAGEKRSSGAGKAAFPVLLGAVFLAFFTDEVAWYIFILVPVVFPEIFRPVKKRILAVVSYFSIFILFLFFITFIVPLITRLLGFGTFNFWGYAVKENPIVNNFKVANVFQHGYNFFSDHINPFYWSSRDSLPGYAVIAVFAGYCLYSYLKLPAARRTIMLRTFIALTGFLVFQTLIMTRHIIGIPSSYYYGSLFAGVFALFASTLFLNDRGSARIINKFLLIAICLISATNALAKNRMDRHYHEVKPFGYPACFPREASRLETGSAISYPMIREVWSWRTNRTELLRMKPRFPLRTLWIFREFEYIHPNNPGELVVK